MSTAGGITTLPLPILHVVFSHIVHQYGSSVGLCRISAVCKIWAEAVSCDPNWHHINVPASQARRFDDRSLRSLASKAHNRLLSFQIDSCRRLSTFCILEVLLNNKQLAEVIIFNCPQVAAHNMTYYLEVVLKQPKPCLKKLCCTSCGDSSDQEWSVATDKAQRAGIDIIDGVSAVLYSMRQMVGELV